jgi:hypothetical protein
VVEPILRPWLGAFDNIYAIAAVWIGLAFLASLISIRVGLSVDRLPGQLWQRAGLSLAFRRNASTCQITSYEGDWASTLQEAPLSPALPQRVVISSSAWRCVIRHSPCSSR